MDIPLLLQLLPGRLHLFVQLITFWMLPFLAHIAENRGTADTMEANALADRLIRF